MAPSRSPQAFTEWWKKRGNKEEPPKQTGGVCNKRTTIHRRRLLWGARKCCIKLNTYPEWESLPQERDAGTQSHCDGESFLTIIFLGSYEETIPSCTAQWLPAGDRENQEPWSNHRWWSGGFSHIQLNSSLRTRRAAWMRERIIVVAGASSWCRRCTICPSTSLFRRIVVKAN